MSKRVALSLLFIVCLPLLVFAQTEKKAYSLAGSVKTEKTNKAVGYATVLIPEANLWAVADASGHFIINKIKKGEYKIKVSCLGYETFISTLNIDKDYGDIVFNLQEQSLAIDEVVVTATTNNEDVGTSRKIGKAALEHLQILNVSDVSTLMPGGKTVNPNLMQNNTFAIRGEGGRSKDAQFASFGTAVEVDGVRLSNNASFSDKLRGVDTRGLASANIGEVEVISGVPSAEIGDVANGIVRIKTKRGVMPYTVSFTSNPRTKQVSIGKGLALGANRGVLNAHLEYAGAISNPVSPYDSYKRQVIDLNYSNTINKQRLPVSIEAGISGNLGGYNSKDDPDRFTGTFSKLRNNSLRAKFDTKVLFNKSWITSLDFNSSISYRDKLYQERQFFATANERPQVNTTIPGYFLVGSLPKVFYSLMHNDSKELNYNLGLKASLAIKKRNFNHTIKLGSAFKANGNMGEGEFYKGSEYKLNGEYIKDDSIKPSGYRPRPYKGIPFMYNFASYIEDNFVWNINKHKGTRLNVVAGLRFEKTFIENTNYKNTHSFSPRINAKFTFFNRGDNYFLRNLSVRGAWGFAEKLPSFGILYPEQKYQDIFTFGASYGNNQTVYVYNTMPYQIEYNEHLLWARNENMELGLDANIGGVKVSLVAYKNISRYPYDIAVNYNPFAYKVSSVPGGYSFPDHPNIKVDSNTGSVYVSDNNNPSAGETLMNTKVINQTFIASLYQTNLSPITRKGLEFVVDFGTIKSLRTSFLFDAKFSKTEYLNTKLNPYYNKGLTHTFLPNRSYQYVGIYAGASGSSSWTYNGEKSKQADLSFTTVTHIPAIRLIVSLRVEGRLFMRSQKLSRYQGKEMAFNVDENNNTTGGSIYNGNSRTALYPIQYMDLDGNVFDFTPDLASKPEFAPLIIRSGRTYEYNQDGYNSYFSANLSITKEIGDFASISFFANNFINTQKTVTFKASGLQMLAVPMYYYGLSLRLKL